MCVCVCVCMCMWRNLLALYTGICTECRKALDDTLPTLDCADSAAVLLLGRFIHYQLLCSN